MWVRPSVVLSAGWPGWSSGALVALGRVEGQFADEFAGGGVDDADVEVLDQDDDAGSGVGSADADGVERPAVAQGDFACLVDAVAADAFVGVVGAVAGGGLGSAGVDRGGGSPAAATGGAVGGCTGRRRCPVGPGGRRWWPAGWVGLGAISSWSAGISRLSRRWWAVMVGSSSGRCRVVGVRLRRSSGHRLGRVRRVGRCRPCRCR